MRTCFKWRMLKRLALAAVLALLLLAVLCGAAAETDGEEPDDSDVRTELERLSGEADLSAWQDYFERLRSSSPQAADYTTAGALARRLAEDPGGRMQTSAGLLSGIFGESFGSALGKTAAVFTAALLTGLCGIVFEDSGIKKLVLLLVCGAAILSVTAAFSSLAGSASAMIGDIAGFAEAAAPALGALLASMGCSESAKLLAPDLAFTAGGAASIVRTAAMPMLLASGVLVVLNGLTESLKLERWIKLIHKIVKWLLGLVSVMYTASAAAGGLIAASADSVTLRSAKYAVDKLIPAAGGMVTGALDAVRSAALLLKNGAGMAALLILAGILIRPTLAILGGMLAFRLTAAASEPFADERIPKMLDGIADTLSLMFACAAAVAAMFAVTVIMMLVAGGTLAGA